MATTTTNTLFLRMAAGAAWEHFYDLARWQSWQPQTQSAEWLAGATPWATNAPFALTRRAPFSSLPGLNATRFVGKAVSAVEEKLLVWELQPASPSLAGLVLVQSVRLDETPAGTTITLTTAAHGAGASLFGFLIKGALQQQGDALLEGLRYALAPIEKRGR